MAKSRSRTDCTKMEFSNINLTKDSSLLLHAIPSPFYWRILQKTILYSGFINPYKKYTKQENSSLFMNSILQKRKVRVENQTKTRVWEDSSLCPQPSTKNAIQEFHLRNLTLLACRFEEKCWTIVEDVCHTVYDTVWDNKVRILYVYYTLKNSFPSGRSPNVLFS